MKYYSNCFVRTHSETASEGFIHNDSLKTLTENDRFGIFVYKISVRDVVNNESI